MHEKEQYHQTPPPPPPRIVIVEIFFWGRASKVISHCGGCVDTFVRWNIPEGYEIKNPFFDLFSFVGKGQLISMIRGCYYLEWPNIGASLDTVVLCG